MYITFRDLGRVHLQWRRSACAAGRLDGNDQPRLGRAEHLARDRAQWPHSGRLFVRPTLYGSLISQQRGAVGALSLQRAGSTRQLANSGGSVTDSYLYDSWGNILSTSGSTLNRFRYVGQIGYYCESDAALYFTRSRNYDPTEARFTARDTYTFSPFLTSLYSYVSNNPVYTLTRAERSSGGGLIPTIQDTSPDLRSASRTSRGKTVRPRRRLPWWRAYVCTVRSGRSSDRSASRALGRRRGREGDA